MSMSSLPFFVAKLAVWAGLGPLLVAYFRPETGARALADTLWLIIALSTMIAPVGLVVFTATSVSTRQDARIEGFCSDGGNGKGRCGLPIADFVQALVRMPVSANGANIPAAIEHSPSEPPCPSRSRLPFSVPDCA